MPWILRKEGCKEPHTVRAILQETKGGNSRRPTFEPPLIYGIKFSLKESPTENPWRLILNLLKGKKLDLGNLDKCLPQAPLVPKYVINTPRIEDQKQHMSD
jgi:hypothetical protein